MADAEQPRVIRFGPFEVDVRAGELRKNGGKIKLQEQPFRILVILLQHAGDLVTREELQLELWPNGTFVDFDHGLNAAIKRLRDALGESAENPVFIETLARRGYRFTASVDDGSAASMTSPRQPDAVPTEPSQAGGKSHWRLAGSALVIAVLAAVLFGTWKYHQRSTAEESIESLAVLPLEDFSHNPEDYLADEMTDALITQLSKVGTLRVRSRTSVMLYKGTHKSLPEIAQELNVDGVIEGSVTRSGNRVRIAVELIRAPKDQHLWAETYERDLGDVLRLQAEVAQAVAQKIRTQLTPAQQARLRATSVVNPEAYEAYLKGRHFEPLGTRAAIKQSQAYFDEAVRKDPGFALAYVGLADSFWDLGSYRWIAPREAYRRSSEAINKALQLDETLGEAHTTLGDLEWRYGWNWRAAEREMRHAVEVNPNYIVGHESLVWFLAWSGRREEALAELATIRHIDPVYPLITLDEAGIYYHLRDYKSLIEAGQKSVSIYPDNWSGHYFLAVGYEGSGKPDQAIPEFQQAIQLSQANSDAIAGLAHAYAITGRGAEAEKLLGSLQQQAPANYVSWYMIAAIYSGLGQKGKAFDFLEMAYRDRSPDLAYFVKADLRMDPLRSDPRFLDLLDRMGLAD
jgi:TolB-like protein/DNA-binding winged helix-turn-helix (wHTH) protein